MDGAFAWLLLGLLLAEICITLWDFIEEDKIRRLPAGERAMHAVMGIVYGAFLAFLIPEMMAWSARDRLRPELSRVSGLDAAGARDRRLRVRDSRPHRERQTGGGMTRRVPALSPLVLRRRHLQRRVGHRGGLVSRPAASPRGTRHSAGAAAAHPGDGDDGRRVRVRLLPPRPRAEALLRPHLDWAGREDLGPIGFVYSAATGTLPWSFGWICLFNDLIWWPVFWRFALRHAREPASPRTW